MVAIVSARTPLRRVGARWTGRCPFHEERTPSFSVNPRAQALPLLRLRQGRRPDRVRPGDRGARVRRGRRVARRADGRRARVRGELAAGGGGPAPPRASLRRCSRPRRSSTRATSGRRRGPSRARVPRRSAGSARRSAGSSASGSRRTARRCPRRPASAASRSEELVAAGLVNRRGNDYFAGRLVFALRDPRGRVRRIRRAPHVREQTRSRPST